MNRNDYKKLMQLKKRNKLVVKGLFLLTFGITTGFIASETAQAQEWTANTSTTIKTGDTEYEIQWGDYLGLISNDSGLTIETLTTLNNISNENLIFAGNVIRFGDGVTAKVVDTNGKTIAETPLTEADKAGIAEKSQATPKPIKVTKNNSDSTTTGTSTDSNAGNNAENPTLPTEPILPTEPVIPPTAPVVPPVLPIDPEKPVDPTNPEKEEVEFNVVYLKKYDINQSGGMSEVEKVKGIVGETLTLTADKDRYSAEGYWLVSEPTVTVTVEKDMAMVIFTYVNNEVAPPEINEGQVSIHYLDETGNSIKETKVFGGEIGTEFLILGEPIQGYELVGNKEYSGIYTETTQSFNFTYKKVAPPIQETADVTIKHVSTEGEVLASSTVTAPVGETVTGVAESFDGYTLQGSSTQSITATNGAVMTFTYVKDEVVPPVQKMIDVPVHHVKLDGTGTGTVIRKALEGTTLTEESNNIRGYTVVGSDTQSVVVKEGAVITFNYTKNVVAPPEIGDWGQRPTSNSELASGDWNGTWYRDTVGNSGMTLPTDSDADMWAVEYMFSDAGKDIKGYWSWEVRMAGTNEIRVTVDFY